MEFLYFILAMILLEMLYIYDTQGSFKNPPNIIYNNNPFSYTGRASRLNYLFFAILVPNIIIFLLVFSGLVANEAVVTTISPISVFQLDLLELITILIIYLTFDLPATIKRARDIGANEGGVVILTLIPFIKIFVVVYLLLSASKVSHVSQEDISLSNEDEKELDDISTPVQTNTSSIKNTLNPIKWIKYTKIIHSAEKKFIDIYNFQTPSEFKKENLVAPLANTVLFEECRQSKLSPNEFEELLVGFGGDDIFNKLIKPVGNTFFDFEAYKTMYSM